MTTPDYRTATPRRLLHAAAIANDRRMLAVVGVVLLVCAGLAPWYSTWLEFAVIGLPAGAMAAAMVKLYPGTRLTHSVVACALMILAGLQIHQAHGALEAHFAVFVLLATLLVYRDWIPLVVAAGAIAVHHLGVFYLQTAGLPAYVLQEANSVLVILVHAGYVVFETAVLVWLAHNMRREQNLGAETGVIGAYIAAQGQSVDLTYRLGSADSDFAQAFNRFMESLQRVVSESSATADALLDAQHDLEGAAASGSNAASRQTQSTATLAATFEELSVSMRSIYGNTQDATSASREVASLAQAGFDAADANSELFGRLSEETGKTAQTVAGLREQSDSIGDVLDVIKKIAEQTNLLALNAAIEAARAGEQGRGFAVVADEVRTLASQTQESVDEIGSVIERLRAVSAEAVASMDANIQGINQGATNTLSVGDSLRSIVAACGEIEMKNAAIEAAIGEQSQAVEATAGETQAIATAASQADSAVQTLAQSTARITDLVARTRQNLERFRAR